MRGQYVMCLLIGKRRMWRPVLGRERAAEIGRQPNRNLVLKAPQLGMALVRIYAPAKYQVTQLQYEQLSRFGGQPLTAFRGCLRRMRRNFGRRRKRLQVWTGDPERIVAGSADIGIHLPLSGSLVVILVAHRASLHGLSCRTSYYMAFLITPRSSTILLGTVSRFCHRK